MKFCKFIWVFMTVLVSVKSMGIGGGSLKYTSRGFFPRQRTTTLNGLTFKTRNGVRFFPDPSPGHLPFQDQSFKMRSEQPSFNRWQWIHDMENTYDEEPIEDPQPMAFVFKQKIREETEAEKIVNDLLRRIELLQKKSGKDESSGSSGILDGRMKGPKNPIVMMRS